MATENRLGMFVVVEGGDGAGKTTQVQRLATQLRARLNRPVGVTRQPGGTQLGAQLRTLLLATGLGHHTIPAKAEALLYLADRAAHAPTLREQLHQGDIVICDRYSWSSIVYQGIGRDLEPTFIEPLCRWATDGLEPDLTILLDLPPDVGLARLAGRRAGTPDRIEAETLDFHQAVRTGYLVLANNTIATGRAAVINADQAEDLVAADVWDAVAELGLTLIGSSAETLTR